MKEVCPLCENEQRTKKRKPEQFRLSFCCFLQVTQQFVDADQFYAQYKDICRQRQFFRRRIRRRNTDIAVVRIFAIRESSAGACEYDPCLFRFCNDCFRAAVHGVKGNKISSQRFCP